MDSLLKMFFGKPKPRGAQGSGGGAQVSTISSTVYLNLRFILFCNRNDNQIFVIYTQLKHQGEMHGAFDPVAGWSDHLRHVRTEGVLHSGHACFLRHLHFPSCKQCGHGSGSSGLV